MKLIAQIYSVYAVVIGLTSYVLISGSFRQTRLTQAYAFAVNALTLVLLPLASWEMAQYMTKVKWLPPCMWIAPYFLYSINYAVIAYTLISRCYRDRILVDLQLVIVQVDGEMSRTGRRISSKLQRLLQVKTLSLTYLCVAFLLSILIYQWDMPWLFVLEGLLTVVSFTIQVAIRYLHFVSFWQIVRGYDFVNHQLEEITSVRLGSKTEAKELGKLWSLHATLSRAARRLNGYYGPQMVACRFDYFMFTIVNGYFAAIYGHYDRKLTIDKCFGASIYWVRSLDFFLNDYICDLVIEYQSKAKYMVTEGSRMSNEVSKSILDCLKIK